MYSKSSSPVLRTHWSDPYSCRNVLTCWESVILRPLQTLICAKNMESSSYRPNNFPWLHSISSPSFSNDWSSDSHDGPSLSAHWVRAFFTKFRRNLHRVDFPEPVGMHTAIQTRTGSTQSRPSTCTSEWDIAKLMIIIKPAITASAGMLIALPTCPMCCTIYSSSIDELNSLVVKTLS